MVVHIALPSFVFWDSWGNRLQKFCIYGIGLKVMDFWTIESNLLVCYDLPFRPSDNLSLLLLNYLKTPKVISVKRKPINTIEFHMHIE